MSQHGVDRASERLTPGETAKAQLLASAFAQSHPGGSHAVRLMLLGKQRGTPWADRSNGDEVWAIVRQGRVTTIMLRRSTQPARTASFDVDQVHLG